MSDMKPALTPEEWARLRYADDNVARQSQGFGIVYGRERIQRPVAFAALALYGRPEGFTHADVVNLKRIGNDYVAWANDSDHLERDIEWGFSLLRLASRIEALLPPDGP